MQYADLVADPVGMTRAIYTAFDLDRTPAVAATVEAMDATSRQGGKRPQHAYALADSGLTEEEVRAAFAP